MKSGSKGWLVGVEAGFIQWDYEGPCYSSEPAGRLCCRCWQVQIGTEFGGADSRHGFVADDLHKSRPRIRLYFFKPLSDKLLELRPHVKVNRFKVGRSR